MKPKMYQNRAQYFNYLGSWLDMSKRRYLANEDLNPALDTNAFTTVIPGYIQDTTNTFDVFSGIEGKLHPQRFPEFETA